MKILVVGSGGREYSLVKKLYEEKEHVLYCAPGNGGIANFATCVPIAATALEEMVDYAKEEQFDLVLVTPDDPLAMGMVDQLQEAGIKAFGPNQAAAEIEASKAFSKELMEKYQIPTAYFEVFDDREKALEYLKTHQYPVVVKADGLALGKGVYICQTFEEAKIAVDEMMLTKSFGSAGKRIIVEEFLIGPEVSLLCFTDGKTVVPLPAAQDHKRAYDGDGGPNTGGMGAFCTTAEFTDEIQKQTMDCIVYPTIEAMNKENRSFSGVLYFGLMLTENGPKVLEYNARFGDPETQVHMPVLITPLSKIMLAIIEKQLDQLEIEFSNDACVCVVLASGGYPGAYEKGKVISGLEKITDKNVTVVHAGTKKRDDGTYETAGGRVMGVVAKSKTLEEAIALAYENVDKIHFEKMQYRTDIGKK